MFWQDMLVLNLGETFVWEFKAQTPLVVTMNSIDIAGLVGSRPSDVKRSIERLAKSGVIQLPPMAKVENKQSKRNDFPFRAENTANCLIKTSWSKCRRFLGKRRLNF